jgi:hypothetical protein
MRDPSGDETEGMDKAFIFIDIHILDDDLFKIA